VKAVYLSSRHRPDELVELLCGGWSRLPGQWMHANAMSHRRLRTSLEDHRVRVSTTPVS
jgi:hypothetical protein